ncbi:MAG: hypothetical protein AAGI23_15530 [Bacteroidota bacterium]
MTTDQKNELDIAINLLKKAAQREQTTRLLLAIFLLGSGLGLLYFFFEQSTLFSIAGLVMLAFGIHLSYLYFRFRDISRLPVFQKLKYQPKTIAWIYTLLHQQMPYGFQIGKNAIMYFKLVDGDEHSVKVDPKRAEVISAGLNHLLPHTTFGYTKEREERYASAPASLVKPVDD